MQKGITSSLSIQERNDNRFRKLAIEHYEQLVESAILDEDEVREEFVTARLEKIKSGDLSIASNLVFIVEGSKIFYDKEQQRAVMVQFTYTE